MLYTTLDCVFKSIFTVIDITLSTIPDVSYKHTISDAHGQVHVDKQAAFELLVCEPG